MSIDFKKGYFDSSTDAHSIANLSSRIESKNNMAILRAYINFRLLFWSKMYFTDASINNNPALRHLMFDDKIVPDHSCINLPRDYYKLLSHSVFKIAVRNTLSIGSHSRELFHLQQLNKHTNLPSEAYSEAIDNIVRDRHSCGKSVAVSYCLESVGLLFATKVKNYLRNEEQENPELNQAKAALYRHFSRAESINFNDILTKLVDNGYAEGSAIYAKIRLAISSYYNTNVPEVLDLNYETSISGLAPNTVIGKYIPTIDTDTSENSIRFNYAFDPELLAYLPSEVMLEALALSQRYKFVTKLNEAANSQKPDIDMLSESLESFVKQLDLLIKNSYSKATFNALKLISPISKQNFTIRIYESRLSRGIQLVLGFIPIVGYISSTLVYFLDQFVIPKIDLTKMDAQQKLNNAQFYQNLSEKSIIVRSDLKN